MAALFTLRFLLGLFRGRPELQDTQQIGQPHHEVLAGGHQTRRSGVPQGGGQGNVTWRRTTLLPASISISIINQFRSSDSESNSASFTVPPYFFSPPSFISLVIAAQLVPSSFCNSFNFSSYYYSSSSSSSDGPPLHRTAYNCSHFDRKIRHVILC